MSSLGHELAKSMRPSVPPNVLSQIHEDDRRLVDDLLILLQELVQTANITACTMNESKTKYVLKIPVSGSISLMELRTLQNHYPSRVQDIIICLETPSIVLHVSTRDAPLTVQEIEIVRVTKRKRTLFN